jgi:hypothetical protein
MVQTALNDILLCFTFIEPQGASHGELHQPSPQFQARWMTWRSTSVRPWVRDPEGSGPGWHSRGGSAGTRPQLGTKK